MRREENDFKFTFILVQNSVIQGIAFQAPHV